MKGRVLVTGADGFIGSHLTEYLITCGYPVRAFCMYNSMGSCGWLDHLPAEIRNQTEIFQGDIRDPFQVKKAMENCEMVFHLAALISIPYSYHAPQQYIQTNVTGTLNVLSAAKELGTRRLLITSTSEVYGSARYVPMDENHPLTAQSPYSAAKIAADKLAESFYRSFDLPVTIVRPFNNYGPRQSVRAIIPSVITQLMSGKNEIYIGNPAPTRDFVFVRDTAEGFRRIAEAESAIGLEINIATENEISIGDLVGRIITSVRPGAKIITDPDRIRPENSEVTRLLGSAARLRQITGWSPQTSLEEGLRQTIDWYAQPENLAYFSRIKNHI
ncbi:MAG: SDR family NAD(P)-dependent oxidoreductase [Bacteroidia bacterium]